MNIIIITINDNYNYGNRLQNFALYNILKKFGKVYTANCLAHVSSHLKIRFLSLFLELKRFKQNISLLFSKNYYVLFKRRYNCESFTRNYVPDNMFTITTLYGIVPRPISDTLFVIGSDQVWNFSGMPFDSFSLRLGSFKGADKIISYAASFGVSEVDDEVKPIFRKYLPRLKAISVREDRGAELVREMTGLNATVVLDPTLMLNTEQWNMITRGFVPNSDRYILTYFLGKPTPEQEMTIQTYAKAHGCRVRRILDLRDKETYVAGPQDFVELFSKAQYVFTDSYHACCFSILYHKQFTVFNRAGMEGRANMNSRMETLFRLFDLNSVILDDGLAPQIDYEKVDQLLTQHRAESQAWLDKAMEA